MLYMDSSALVKRYVEEEESPAVVARIESAPIIGTALITRVEVPAALKKAIRTGDMDRDEAEEARREFLEDWPDLTRIGGDGRAGRTSGHLGVATRPASLRRRATGGGAHVAGRT